MMIKIKSYPFFMLGCAVMTLTGCETVQSSDARLPAQTQAAMPHVVLADPTADDSMLPAIGESLSKGQVTIYPLSGALPAGRTGMLATSGAGAVQPPVSLPPQDRVALKPMSVSQDGSVSSDGVTVYSLETGAPVGNRITDVAAPVAPPPAPALPPLSSAAPKQLQSPFASDGSIAADAGVTPSAKKRPPKGMTY